MLGYSPPDGGELSFLYLQDYEFAARKARQAQFEFGKTPTPPRGRSSEIHNE
jgi:hypothetical protein